MPIRSVGHLTEILRQSRLLDDVQTERLALDLLPHHADPRALAAELVRLGWLTAYQLGQLFQGTGPDLLLGSYVLLEKLGEGGMGQVYKARDWQVDRVVALKLIRKERLPSAGALRRFHREIRAAMALSHPNVVRAHGADEVNGTHLLVMEFVEGIDLARLVRRDGPLPVELACDCVRQAALGLQHAHERGLVHRDIKPANLMRTSDGVVKLLDLGLARLVRPDGGDGSSTMTADGAVMGTPDYIAPEQALEAHAVDIRADLYSLGCTLYFLLTGEVPFPGRTLTDKLLRHQLHEPRRIEELRPDVPAAVVRVVRRLMAKRPVDRYQTPAELVAVLAAGGEDDVGPGDEAETVVQGCPTVARPPVEADAPRGWRGQKGRRLPCILAACLALLVGVAAWWFTPKPSAPLAGPEDTESAASDGARAAEPAVTEEEAGLAEVAALPARRQVEAVAAALQERNPGFDGRVKPTIEGDVVTGLRLRTDRVTDLSPLRALTGLRRLYCGGTKGEGRLADLSPLRGLKLTELACPWTRVSDLSPLEGMDLDELNVWSTPVSDLSPLRGMKLRMLSCGGTRVADLKPLAGMELEELNVWGTPVSDLSPLRGMQLTTLACGMTQVSDLSPLQGMTLRTLHCDHTPVRDLSPLRGMRLTCLSCESTQVADHSPLRDMPLRTLWWDFRPERDVEVLRSLRRLETINGKPAAPFRKALEDQSPLVP